MAATGKTPILLYGSTTATNAPVAGNLTNSSDGCEIAINVADKNLFFKDSTNVVNTVPIRQSSASSSGWLSSTDWTTFNNKQSALGYTPVNKAGDTMTGSLTAPSLIPSSSTVPSNGMYLPGSNTLGWGTNSTFRMSLDGSGNLATTGAISSNTTVTAATSLKANLALGSGANIDTSGQTAITLAASSNALLVSGSGYYLVAISEVTQTGQSGVYMLTNGTASLVSDPTSSGTTYWKASTTTPANLQFSIASSGGNYRIYNGNTTAGTYTFKATIIKIS